MHSETTILHRLNGWNAYGSSLYRFAYSQVDNQTLAEDPVQDTFSLILTGGPDYSKAHAYIARGFAKDRCLF